MPAARSINLQKRTRPIFSQNGPHASSMTSISELANYGELELDTVNSRYYEHSRDRDLVSVLARVRNSGVQEKYRKCICWIYGKRKYSDRLDELIQGDEAAKLAYEETNVTRKAKAGDGKQRKYIMIVLLVLKNSGLLSVIARVKTIKLCHWD